MLKNRTLSRCFIFFSFILFFTSQVLADQYHYNNILIGNRAAGLAGSYVAIADDPSGLYYNPSGIVYAPSGNITANMNAYNISQTKYIGALKTSAGKSVDWIRTSSALVPNFFGITQPLGGGTIGFSYAITNSTLEDQGQTFNDIRQAGTTYTINFNNQDVTNNIGPSYAFSISDNFSVGLTLYGYFRNQKQIFNQIYQIASDSEVNKNDVKQPPFFISNQYYSLKEYGIKPILGFMYTPMEKISLGLTLSQTFLFSSDIENQFSSAANICLNEDGTLQVRCPNTQPTSFLLAQQKLKNESELPWQINVGGSYFVNNRLILSANAWIYEAINKTTRPLVNVAGGLEFYITGKFAIRMGAYTNLSNTPKLEKNKINDINEHTNIYGATLSFTNFTRSSALSIGTAGTYGKGEAQIAGNTAIQEVRYFGLSIFLSASNSF